MHDWLEHVALLREMPAENHLTKLLIRVDDSQCCFSVWVAEALGTVGTPADGERLAAGLPEAFRGDDAGLIEALREDGNDG